MSEPCTEHPETLLANSTVCAAVEQAARLLGRPSLAPVKVGLLVAALEWLVLGVSGWFVFYASTPAAEFNEAKAAAFGVVLASMTVVLSASISGYVLKCLVDNLQSALRSLAGFGTAVALLSWLHTDALPAVFAADSVVVAVAVLVPFRLTIAFVTRWAVDCGLTARRAVLAGSGEEAELVVRGLASRPGNDIRICAIFDDRDATRTPDLVLNVPKVGRFDDLVSFCRIAEIDLVIICFPASAEQRIAQLLDKFRVLPVQVHLSAFNRKMDFSGARGAGLLDASFRAEQRLLKRTFDLLFGSLLLVLWAPLLALIAILIKLDSPGPVFFCQSRHGFNDRPVKVWKFRTMYADQADPLAQRIVTRGDARVTRVGKFLRKSSLDELPQLFNVVSGELSLVGPRPHAIDARSNRQEPFAQLVKGYSARHRLPPGITGWAQIHGLRGGIERPEEIQKRVAFDLYYIENWSLWLDLLILLRTPFALLNTRHAY